MNSSELNVSWNEQKDRLKKQFATLTDNDMLFKEGMKEEMIEKIQKKLGKTKEEMQKIISSL